MLALYSLCWGHGCCRCVRNAVHEQLSWSQHIRTMPDNNVPHAPVRAPMEEEESRVSSHGLTLDWMNSQIGTLFESSNQPHQTLEGTGAARQYKQQLTATSAEVW